MKFISVFTKTPQHKKFSYTPRFYDPLDEQMKEREERIRKELETKHDKAPVITENEGVSDSYNYRSRISGSFRVAAEKAKKSNSRQRDPSAAMLRLIILLFMVIWLLAFIQFGNITFYGLLLFVPFYFYLKFRSFSRNKSAEQ